MNDVVRHSGMVRVPGKDRFQNLAALALVRKSLVGLRRGDRQCQSVKNRGFVVIRICSLERGHFLLKSLRVEDLVLAIFFVNFGKSFDITFLARGRAGVYRRNLLRLADGHASGIHIAVTPQTVIMRHGHAPISHRAVGILIRDIHKRFARLFVLEGMQ